jgi:uncharacterized membrane protein
LDGLIALVVLVALTIPAAAIAGFFMALGARSRLSQVESRLTALEGALARAARAAEVAADLVAAPRPAPTAAPPPSEPEKKAEPIEAAAAPEQPPAPVPEAAVSPPPSPPPPTAAAQPEPSFEERLGTRWVVWVGGVALALGAVFLVRYTIEQGLIGPGVRIMLGALFAAALIAAGEWSRRQEKLSGLPGLPQASIPAILTAAGTVAAYATAYAAYALYGFIGPGAAFVLLGVVGLATLAAALLHGPALAGLGLIGAYVTPFLISTKEPSFWALYLYLAVVTAAAFALARLRMWRWLAIATVAFSALWMFPALSDAAHHSTAPHAFYVVVCFVLAALLIVPGLASGPEAVPDTIEEISSVAVAAYLVAAALLVMASGHDTLAMLAFSALVAATVAIAWRAPAVTAALPVAAALAALVIAEWAVDLRFETLIAPAGPTADAVPQPLQARFSLHLALGAAFALLFGAAGFLAQGRAERPVIPLVWAATATAAPIAILIALYYRIHGIERSLPFAAIALLLAALYGYATEVLTKRPPRPGSASAAALFAVGAVASLALALTLALEKGWLTVSLALMALGVAWIAEQRPLPFLRWLAAAAGMLVLGRIMWEPRIVGDAVGATPIFNWLLWGYGVPAAAFWTAGHLLRRRADDVPARTMDSLAILFTALTAFLEIRHFVNDGDVYSPSPSLAELGMQVSVGLAMAIGLERVRGRTNSPVHGVAALIIAGLTLLGIVFGLLIEENPLIEEDVEVQGVFFNLVLLCYGLPAVLATVLALIAKDTRPMAYRAVATAAAIVLALAYLTLEVRRLYQGPELLSTRGASDAELWTYSAVWLAFGVVLLLAGLMIRSQPARLASAVVILVTVCKVFLYDLAGIGGIWRALSFIGLGLVLVGIGWLYQRLLFPPRNHQEPHQVRVGSTATHT